MAFVSTSASQVLSNPQQAVLLFLFFLSLFGFLKSSRYHRGADLYLKIFLWRLVRLYQFWIFLDSVCLSSIQEQVLCEWVNLQLWVAIRVVLKPESRRQMSDRQAALVASLKPSGNLQHDYYYGLIVGTGLLLFR